MGEKVIPLIRGNPKVLEQASREELVELFSHYKTMNQEMLRRAIVEKNRIDLLATQILDYQTKPFHLAMMKFQFQHPQSMILAFRGSGKSTICTITKAIHLLLKDPNLRICIASKTTGNAEGFLKEIKAHFENNQKLAEVFGPYFDPRTVTKWDNKEIEVLPRTRHTKEASITCVGVEGTIVSKHYDVILADDLVDEDNSRTKYTRDKTRTWYYTTLDPTLLPPSPEHPHRGERHVLGTRYHNDDLYNHFIENEFALDYKVIKALDDQGRSPWPEMYPPAWFEDKKKKSGTIIFDAQYQNDTEAMKGEVFQYDDCQVVDDKDIPNSLKLYQGIDLAITELEKNDQFADIVIGEDRAGNIYVMDFFLDHIPFSKQKRQALEFYDEWDPIRCAVESNAYQAAFRISLIDDNQVLSLDKQRDLSRFLPIFTDKDKMTRAWKLQPLFENKKVFFRKNMGRLIEQFVLFPSFRFDDGPDAFDFAYRASKMRRKRPKRTYEPGLI